MAVKWKEMDLAKVLTISKLFISRCGSGRNLYNIRISRNGIGKMAQCDLILISGRKSGAMRSDIDQV